MSDVIFGNSVGADVRDVHGREGRWHCIWVSLEERDTAGRCVFKSFNDVYLERLDRGPSPKKRSRTRTFSQTSHKQEA